MRDDDTPQQLAPAPQLAPVAGAMVFDHAAMLMGRSLYWNTSPQDHVTGIKRLLEWCLALPGARLGVALTGVAQIVQSLVSASAQPLSPQVEAILGKFGTKLLALRPFGHDIPVWGPHLTMLLGWMAAASGPDDYVWLEGDEQKQWIEATIQSLKHYNDFLDSSVEDSVRLQLMTRHLCTVFAPFDGASVWDHADALAGSLTSPRRDAMHALLADPRFSRAQLANISSVYWSWRVLNFADADGSIICTPMLGLWSEYPSSKHWAPQSPLSLAAAAPRTEYSADGIAHLLEGVYWQVLETIFNSVRQACGLGVAEPEFNEIESRPPVFFFAAPVAPPELPEEYAGSWRRTIYPLIKSCLLSNDPLADQIAWGLLEGDLVALRREMSSRRYYQSRYLVLPTVPKSRSAGPIEEDVGDIADQLTYLEFSMGHETRDVYTDMDPLAVRAAIWGGTLDRVADVTSQAIDILPALSQRDAKKVNERLAQLNLVLRRVQAVIETGASDANQVQRTYDAYLDGTEDYMRRAMTVSSVPHSSAQSLPQAVLNAYPYKYIKQPLTGLLSFMGVLRGGVARISDSLNSALEQVDRDARGRQSLLNSTLNILLAFVGLLVGLLQVVGSQLGGSSNATPSGLFTQVFKLPALNGLVQDAVTVVGALVVLMSISYIVLQIVTRLARSRHRFIVGVQELRGLVEQAQQRVLRVHTLESKMLPEALAAASVAGERAGAAVIGAAEHQIAALWLEIDRLDDTTTEKLSQLWNDLRQLAESNDNADKRTVRAWITRARILEHMIELFDLSPTTIPLPRMLCVLRFKSTDLRSRTTVSDWDFESSLGLVKFSPREIKLLDNWLSAFGNPEQIKAWDVGTFVRVLKEHGVSASPDLRNPLLWQGSLEGADKAQPARA